MPAGGKKTSEAAFTGIGNKYALALSYLEKPDGAEPECVGIRMYFGPGLMTLWAECLSLSRKASTISFKSCP